jgi:hypothetical protein
MVFGAKTFFVSVLARDAEGVVVGVECASSLKLGWWLRGRVVRLRCCLPFGSRLVVVFPSYVGEGVRVVVKWVDEVWVVGKNGMVERMMFRSFFRKE